MNSSLCTFVVASFKNFFCLNYGPKHAKHKANKITSYLLTLRTCSKSPSSFCPSIDFPLGSGKKAYGFLSGSVETCRSHAGPVEEWAGARQNGLRFFFLLQSSWSDCADAHVHTNLKLCWSYVFLDAGWFITLFYCNDPKTLNRLRRLDWPDVSWASLYISLRVFFCKSPDRPIFHVYLMLWWCGILRPFQHYLSYRDDLSAAKTQIKLCCCLLYWAIKNL